MSGPVGGVSNSGAIAGAQGLSPAGLTPDTLMLYCASRLRDVDGQIAGQMRAQQDAHGAQEKLNAAKRALLEGNQNDPATKERVMTALRDAYEALPEGDPQRAALNGIFHEYVTTVSYNNDGTARTNDKSANGDGYNLWNLGEKGIHDLANRKETGVDNNNIDAKEVKKYQDSIDGVVTDLGKDAELKMINLQSLISQRQLAIQSVTQMLTKVNEGYSAIAANIK